MLKKNSALLFLTIYLFSATTTRELLKLPYEVDHYYQHNTQNKQIGIISFQNLLYNKGAASHVSRKDDNRLPFKSTHINTGGSFISLTPPLFIEISHKPDNQKNRGFQIPTHLHFFSRLQAAIWQPPRNC